MDRLDRGGHPVGWVPPDLLGVECPRGVVHDSVDLRVFDVGPVLPDGPVVASVRWVTVLKRPVRWRQLTVGLLLK